MKKRMKWAASTRPLGAGENQRSHNRPNSSTWMDSLCSLWTDLVGMSYFLDRLAAPLLCLTICVAAQPNPIWFSSFPILLSMHWHFYPPIKTFKGPLSKRKECCFNSVVAPCLGPFFSVCNQPALANCLMFSSQRRAKRGPSPLWGVWQQLSADREPSIHCPKHSEQTINPWHAFHYFSPIVSVSRYMALRFKRACSTVVKNLWPPWIFCSGITGVDILAAAPMLTFFLLHSSSCHVKTHTLLF